MKKWYITLRRTYQAGPPHGNDIPKKHLKTHFKKGEKTGHFFIDKMMEKVKINRNDYKVTEKVPPPTL